MAISEGINEDDKQIVIPLTVKLVKHDLETNQDGEDNHPFSSKMKSALDCLDEAYAENVYQYDRFGANKSGHNSSEEEKEEQNINKNRKLTKHKKEQKRLDEEAKVRAAQKAIEETVDVSTSKGHKFTQSLKLQLKQEQEHQKYLGTK